ncbi:MAG: DNA polymerase/3'-5' exonuclease PolX [bacterium]
MPVINQDIADIFNKLADLLDIQDENPFRIRAYRRAAQTILNLSRKVTDMIAEGEDLTRLPGIGKELALKIDEIVRRGSLRKLNELEKEIPPELSDMMKLSDLGPKRVKIIYKRLGIESINALEKAARQGKLQKLEGLGQKTEEKILQEIQRWKERGEKKRFKLVHAEEITGPLLDYLKQFKGVKEVEAAGSYRRHQETVGDMDILVTCQPGIRDKLMEHFISYEDVDRVISRGKTRSTVILKNGLQVDLRAVAQDSYGAALYYFTGSKAHNIKVRKMAAQKNLKVNEYGVFKNDDKVAGKTEEEVFNIVGLNFILPELREDRGEIEASLDNVLPHLVTVKDIKGDLQSHTTASDGRNSLKEMAAAARSKGYKYLAVTDHSKRVTVAHGLDEKRLREQLEEIDELNEQWKDFRVLKSSEVDILKDGSLDLPNEVLKELDLVICSVHYNSKLSRKEQTKRVLRAMENPYFHIMAHPTGRLIGKREAYDIDLEEIMKEAKENGCFFEINADPERLDLSDIHARLAKDMGIKIAISTDAHTISGLDNMRFGVYQARRAWLEPEDVLNTRSWNDLQKIIKHNKI